MINFSQYDNCTKIVIPGAINLSTTNFSKAFSQMSRLQYLNINKRIENEITIISAGGYAGSICYSCSNLINSAICGDKVINMSDAYDGCTNLTTAVCGPNVTSMTRSYIRCTNLITAVCGDKVTNMYGAYQGCTNLTTAVCGPNVEYMNSAYDGCTNLTTAVCGPNVTSMRYAYNGCTNLTTAVCGDKVTDMGAAYNGCTNLTTPVCGPNVSDMGGAYTNCTNLTTAVCGPNVTDMYGAYENCTNLTTAVCGPNVTNMYAAYNGCTNIQGNSYFYPSNISSIRDCFKGRNTSNMLNIYVEENSTTMNNCLINRAFYSLTGSAITWTNDSANKRYYNTQANIYIYPVANVYKAEETAMLQDFTYDDNGDGTYTLTGWKETYQGKPSTEMVIPDSPKVIL